MAVMNLEVGAVPREVAARFETLAARWREDTEMLSSTTARAMHPAYQQIIGMGPSVLPLLLREIERRPDAWFWALGAITGEDPVRPEDRGRRQAMAQAWLQWGRERGYLS